MKFIDQMPFEPLNCFAVPQNTTASKAFSFSPCNENRNFLSSNIGLHNKQPTGMMKASAGPILGNMVTNICPARVKGEFELDVLNQDLVDNLLPTTNIRLNGNNQNMAVSTQLSSVRLTKISRVLIVTCSNVEALKLIIQCSFDPAAIVIQKLSIHNVGNVLVLGWYDIRHISLHLDFLQKIIPSYNISNFSFSHIAEDSKLSQIVCMPKLNYFEDIYDTIYLYVHSQHQNDYDPFEFQNDIYFQLSKFGALYEISVINEGFVCYKCKFYNIRTPFLIRKLHTIKIRDLKTMIFQTLIETNEYVTLNMNRRADWKSCQNIMPHYDILGEEWKKYQFLKHRRLGSIPFNNNEIKNENKINIAKILSGEDKRVTLMIKNIPNKVKHEELKDFIDATNFGDYQFLCMICTTFLGTS